MFFGFKGFLFSELFTTHENAQFFIMFQDKREYLHFFYFSIKTYVIDKPWLLSRFWVYCKLYHSLVTFHCLTSNEAEPSLGRTVKGHQIMI